MSLYEDAGVFTWRPGDPIKALFVVDKTNNTISVEWEPSNDDVVRVAKEHNLNPDAVLNVFRRSGQYDDCHTLYIDGDSFREANGPYAQEL